MPFVLDYDGWGNVTGGHMVEQLSNRSTRPVTPPLKLDPPPSTHRQALPNSGAVDHPPPNATMSWPPDQAPPDGYPAYPRGPPPAPAAYPYSGQDGRQPDVVPTVRFSQHAANADLHPYLQQRGPSTHQVAPFARQHLEHHQRQSSRQQHLDQQLTIHHPRPQRTITHRPERSLFPNGHLQIDDDRRIPSVLTQAVTPAHSIGAWQINQTGRAPSAVTIPPEPFQRSTTYPVSVPKGFVQGASSSYGSLVTIPASISHGSVRRPSSQHASPSPAESVAQPLPPYRPPVTIPAPPGGIKNYAKAKNFVDRFAAHFGKGSRECALFEHLAVGYNRKEVSKIDFYAGVYRILYRNDALYLLPDFMDFFPDSWDSKDLTWVNRVVERDSKELAKAKSKGKHLPSSANAESAGHDPLRDHRTAASNKVVEAQKQPVSGKPAPKKKRPINGFSTKHREDHDGTINPAVLKPAHHPPIPPTPNSAQLSQSDDDAEGDKAPMADAAAHRTPEHRPSPALVKLRLKVGPRPTKQTPSSSSRKTTSANRPQRAASISATKKRKATEALDTQARTPNGSNHYGNTPASQVPHIGPVYRTRRSVLNRESRPYIHLACGARFAHPGDVKAHVRKGNQGNGCGDLEKWNEHSSCQADYVDIHYARVMEGFVILDQESWDRLESAIQAGLAYASEHPQQEVQASDQAANKVKKVGQEKTAVKKKTALDSDLPPVETPEEPTKYEFEFDTEGDADAEGEDDPVEDENESTPSAPPAAAPTFSGVAKTSSVRISNGDQEKSEGEDVAQPSEQQWEWDGTALRAVALGLRKRPRL